MHTTSLRKVGGSVMVTVPPAFLDQLHLQAGSTVGVTVSEGRLIIDPKPKPRYSMAELLAASDFDQAPKDSDWVSGPAIGGELL